MHLWEQRVFALYFLVICALAPVRARSCKRHVCVCLVIKTNHSSKKLFPVFKHLSYNLASDKLKPLTLVVNITPATTQFIQLHPNESN